MRTLTVRLPDALVTEIERESIARRVSKSDIVRGRLAGTDRPRNGGGMLESIADIVGSVEGLPPKLSAGKKRYLAEIIRAQKTNRR
jgi:hypothetical protein